MSADGSNAKTPAGTACGQPIIQSPFNYHGAAGAYKSGTAGLPTYGTAKAKFWWDKAGVVIPPGTRSLPSYKLRPNTVYYLAPGLHIGSIQADTGDTFIGGYYGGQATTLSGQYQADMTSAIDSNTTDGDQKNATVQFLRIEKFRPSSNSAAVNLDSNTGWAIKDNVISLNAPGAGVILGAHDILEGNCLTLNGQYGFQSEDTDSWGKDSLTGGPFDLIVKNNEISYNDTCDFEGVFNNSAVGWHHYNPVPVKYRNAHCGTVTPDGDQGGFKLWETNNVIVAGNYIHNNWGPGAWADTDNANTTYVNNTFTNNDFAAVMEEASYNFSITKNYMADNNWIGGLSNPGYPAPAIYISESGSDRTFGGVPGKYRNRSVISGNTLVNNGGNVFLWQNSNRFCSDGSDTLCTLVAHGRRGPFTAAHCQDNLPTASLRMTTMLGTETGSPTEDWADGCMWRTENVDVTGNVIDFNPAAITDCTKTDWPLCGTGGIFSEYGSPPDHLPDWAVPTQVTFDQNNVWSKNVYHGPSIFYAWSQGNGDNPVSWAQWTGSLSTGDECSSSGEHTSGFCRGPFGQDAGGKYTK